ncbi:MAG TPA: hypothetical protein VK473_07170, partial [Terriglobales bacterium]|nr:hypothetical protein [Terriglobales bacterium]
MDAPAGGKQPLTDRLATARVPILYLIVGVLIVISVVPMYFYSREVVAINRERLISNERLLQTRITLSLGNEIAQKLNGLDAMLSNLSSAIQITSGGNIGGDGVNTPELRALLEKFVSSSGDLAYATLLNSDAKGQAVGRIVPDEFLQHEMERAFTAAHDGRAYKGQALSLGSGKDRHVVILVSVPLLAGGRFYGMLGAAVDLGFVIRNLNDVSAANMLTYVVDQQGRLVAAPDSSHFATGQNMTKF